MCLWAKLKASDSTCKMTIYDLAIWTAIVIAKMTTVLEMLSLQSSTNQPPSSVPLPPSLSLPHTTDGYTFSLSLCSPIPTINCNTSFYSVSMLHDSRFTIKWPRMFIELNQDYSAINLFKKETVMTGSIYHSADSLKIFGRLLPLFFFYFYWSS